MTDTKHTSLVVRESSEVSTPPQFGHRLISRAANDAIEFLPPNDNLPTEKTMPKVSDRRKFCCVSGQIHKHA